MTYYKLLVIFLVSVSFTVAAAQKKSKSTKNIGDLPVIEHGTAVFIKIPDTPEVVFHGKPNFDRVGVEGGDILYPAPDAGTMVAGVLFHAFLANTLNNNKKDEKQIAADSVLTPYSSVIQSMSYEMLFNQGIEHYNRSGSDRPRVDLHNESISNAWIIESVPVFLFSQAQDVLILQNTIAIYLENDPGKMIYQTSVEVVSDSLGNTEPRSYWLMDEGEKLKSTSATLLSSSFSIILSELFGRGAGEENVQQTFRYAEGNQKVIERGGLISKDCERILIRTLWQTLKSAPIYQTEADKLSCLANSGPAFDPR